LPVDAPLNPSPVVAITLKNRTQKSAAERFVDCARVTMKSLGGGHLNDR
jgi:hypothetical protein